MRPSHLLVAALLFSPGLMATDDADPVTALTGAAQTASLDLGGLDATVFARAKAAWFLARAEGQPVRPVLAVIDYTRPSSERRLWVFDLDTNRLLHHELVAHGKGTGELLATRFSNRSGSHQSSLGTFVVGDAYSGKHGRSLKLHGLERGLNDAALARAVVIHAATYVSDAVVAVQGRLGRSWGCPALDPKVAGDVMDTLEGGAVLVAWHDDATLLSRSRYLNAPRVASR